LPPIRQVRARPPMMSVIEAYKAFDQRQPGWLKVELKLAA
jgi:threonine dehydrogenase-like Zn-dependent dehydrogenase